MKKGREAMYFIESNRTDPYYNLAMEEYLFRIIKPDDSCFMLWQNENTIVVGRYQNTAEEINQQYVEKNHIRVARRLSGGGAVYHDSGNLNFTFIVNQAELEAFKFEAFLNPLMNVLNELGITAECSGRNDVTIQGKKISGNSQYLRKKRILHHGCIMLDSNLTAVSQALKVKEAKFDSKSVKSVRSRVTTINEHASKPVTMTEFKQMLTNAVAAQGDLQPLVLTEAQLEEIMKLRDEKYATWDWNYGASPSCNMKCERKFDSGLVTVYMQAEKNRIQKIRFYGDFFGSGDLADMEKALEGTSLNSDLEEKLSGLNVGYYMNGISADDIYQLLTQ